MRCDNGRRSLVLVPHVPQSVVLCFGSIRTTWRPCLAAMFISSVFVVLIAASAALRAMVDFARNLGWKSSTAMRSKSITTFFAHTRAVCCR